LATHAVPRPTGRRIAAAFAAPPSGKAPMLHFNFAAENP